MKKFGFLLSLVVVAGLTMVGCSSKSNTTDTPSTETPKTETEAPSTETPAEQPTLTLMQNKPEIDAQLKAFVAKYEEETGVKIKVKSCGGDSCQLGTQLKADIAAGDAPDIFVIDGVASYQEYESLIMPLDGESWVSQTDVAFENNGTVYGFPIFIEGWGLAYNADLLEKAGIDPATLNNLEGYKVAFEKLDAMKAELGIDSVVSMAAGAGMEWVTRDHNINSYLSNGLARNDMSVVDKALNGELDVARFTEYAQWVNLLFDYSNPTVLTTGNYDDQVGAFANQKAVFVHQGNWIEPNIADLGVEPFNRAYAPQGSSNSVTDGIFVGCPSWYVVNKDSKYTQEAKDFLTYLGTTEAGHNFVINDLGAAPAINGVENKPEKSPLTMSIMEWADQGKTYAWNQYFLPESFREELGPIYGLLAQDAITVEQFVEMMVEQFATLKK